MFVFVAAMFFDKMWTKDIFDMKIDTQYIFEVIFT